MKEKNKFQTLKRLFMPAIPPTINVLLNKESLILMFLLFLIAGYHRHRRYKPKVD